MNKLMIIILIAMVVLGMAATVLVVRDIMLPVDEDVEIIDATDAVDTAVDPENAPEEKDITDFEKDPGKPFEPVPETKDMLTEAEEQNLLTSVRRLIRHFEFKEASEMLLDARMKNLISPESEIHTLYNDSAYLQHIKSGADNGSYMGIDMIKILKDPETVLLAMLYLDGFHREPYVRDDRSLSPEFEGLVTVNSSNTLDENDAIYDEIARMDTNLKAVHLFNISLEGNQILAYVGVSETETYLYRMDEFVIGTTGYFTIKHITEMENLINGPENNIIDTTEPEMESAPPLEPNN